LLLRSTLIYAPAILATRLSALLILVIATRLIDIGEYGLLALVVTVGEMTDAAVSNWLRIALLRLGGKGDVTRGSLMLAARILVISTLVALAVSTAASAIVVPERVVDFSLAVGSYLVAGAINRFALTTLQMQQRSATYSMLEFVRAGLQLGLPILAVGAFPATFLTVSLGSSAGVLIAGLIAGLFAASRVVQGPARFTWLEFFKLGVPLIVMALVGFGLGNFERIVLKVYYDAGSVALFAAAYALARQPIDMLGNAVNMGAFPEAVSRFDSDGPAAAGQFLSSLLAVMLGLILPAAAVLVALSEPLTTLLLPAEYHGQFGLLFPLIAASVVCSNIANFVYGTMILAHKKSRLLVIVSLVGSLATIGLSFALVPPFAGNGAAVALAGGSLVMLVAMVIAGERLTHVPLPLREVGIAILIAVIAGGVAAAANQVLADEAAIVRLAIGGGLAGIVFLGLNAMLRFHETADLFARALLRLSGAKG
jgi:O-antigen/teichoic acid export membrane protein